MNSETYLMRTYLVHFVGHGCENKINFMGCNLQLDNFCGFLISFLLFLTPKLETGMHDSNNVLYQRHIEDYYACEVTLTVLWFSGYWCCAVGKIWVHKGRWCMKMKGQYTSVEVAYESEFNLKTAKQCTSCLILKNYAVFIIVIVFESIASADRVGCHPDRWPRWVLTL